MIMKTHRYLFTVGKHEFVVYAADKATAIRQFSPAEPYCGDVRLEDDWDRFDVGDLVDLKPGEVAK